jgi:alkylation response protein AidB-like acyl-CoA dehydrogenase
MRREDLPTEVQDLATATRDVAVARIGPLVRRAEAEHTFMPEIREVLAEMGLFGVVVPEQHGGVEADVRHQMVVLEELAGVYPSACTYLTAHWLATKLIARNLGDPAPDWAKPLLSDAATGARIGAIAVTEAEAGSDLASARMAAKHVGDHWELSGTKRFITNGGFCDYYTVLARTGEAGARGLSLFLVEADRPGVLAARFEEKMGLHGSATAEMEFTDVIVPDDHLIGEPGRGFQYVMQAFDEGRIGVAAMSLGIAEAALRASQTYATERRQFGHAIAHFQGVQFLIADMAIAVETSRSLLYDAAQAVVEGRGDASRLSAIAKTYVTDSAMTVATDAVQVHGGYGYINEFPVEMLMRDAKIGQIYEGTNQILRMVIARSYLGEHAR